jgi:pimeloyl-ACP methyl ester carboxylesterase
MFPRVPPNQIEELRLDVDGVDTFYRRLPGEGLPTLFLHGNPTHSEDWIPFLAGIDGPAIAPLVVWGGKDAYLPPEFGPAYTEKLPNAELLALPDAGHWPWFDRPDTIARILNFLSSA